MDDQSMETTVPVDQHVCVPCDAVRCGLEVAWQRLDDLGAEMERRFHALQQRIVDVSRSTARHGPSGIGRGNPTAPFASGGDTPRKTASSRMDNTSAKPVPKKDGFSWPGRQGLPLDRRRCQGGHDGRRQRSWPRLTTGIPPLSSPYALHVMFRRRSERTERIPRTLRLR